VTSTTIATGRDSSYRKQVLYRRYAEGALTLSEVAKEVADVVPPGRPVSRSRWIGGVVVSLLGALLFPLWGVKKD
jgi:hypothetical protein